MRGCPVRLKIHILSTLRSKKAQENGLTEERINAGCGDFLSDNNFSEAENCSIWALTQLKPLSFHGT